MELPLAEVPGDLEAAANKVSQELGPAKSSEVMQARHISWLLCLSPLFV